MSLSCFYNHFLRILSAFDMKTFHTSLSKKAYFRLCAAMLAVCSTEMIQNDVMASASSETSNVMTIDDTEVEMKTYETSKQTIHKYSFPVDSFAKLATIADELIPGDAGPIFPFLDCDETIVRSLQRQSVGGEAAEPLSFLPSPDLFRTYEDNAKAAIEQIHARYMTTESNDLSEFEKGYLAGENLWTAGMYYGKLPGNENTAIERLNDALIRMNINFCQSFMHIHTPLDQADLTLFSQTKWGSLGALRVCSGLGFNLERGQAIKQAFSIEPGGAVSITLPNWVQSEGGQYLCSAKQSKSQRIMTDLKKRLLVSLSHDASSHDVSGSSSEKRVATIILVDNAPKVIRLFLKNFDPSELPFDVIHVIAAQHNQYKAMASIDNIIADYNLYMRNGEAERLHRLTVQDDDVDPYDSCTDSYDSNPDTYSDSGDPFAPLHRHSSRELLEQDIEDLDDSGDTNQPGVAHLGQLFSSLSLLPDEDDEDEKDDGDEADFPLNPLAEIKKDSQSNTPSDD